MNYLALIHFAGKMMISSRTIISTGLLVASLLFITGCLSERDTKLSVKGGNPPKFTMTGNGRLVKMGVYGPGKQREGVGGEEYAYWEIKFEDSDSARKVEGLGSITYGEVPEGYYQSFPSSGRRPLPLPEEEPLGVSVETMNANGSSRSFAIHKGKVVEDPVIENRKPVFND